MLKFIFLHYLAIVAFALFSGFGISNSGAVAQAKAPSSSTAFNADKSQVRELNNEELRRLLSGVVLNPGSTIDEYFYKDGRFLMFSEVPTWGNYTVHEGKACIFIGEKKRECLQVLLSADGHYSVISTLKPGVRFTVKFAPISE